MEQKEHCPGAAGGIEGSTGRRVASLLIEQGIPVHALVHKLDSRSDELRQRGAEAVEADLLHPASVRAAMRQVRRAYFTYPVKGEALRRYLERERINPHALDHLTHLWQYFRRGAQSTQPTDAIRVVTGREPQSLEEFFRPMPTHSGLDTTEGTC